MRSIAGRTSPSFLITVAVAVLAVAGYVAWQIWRPNPVVESDIVVREFVRTMSQEMRAYRRSLRAMTADVEGDEAAAIAASVQDRAKAAVTKVEELADAALDRIDELEGISFQTQRNRIGRIRGRLQEAREAIALEAEDAIAEWRRSQE